jgi:hypothetical protein
MPWSLIKTVGKNVIIEKTTPTSIEKSPYLRLKKARTRLKLLLLIKRALPDKGLTELGRKNNTKGTKLDFKNQKRTSINVEKTLLPKQMII